PRASFGSTPRSSSGSRARSAHSPSATGRRDRLDLDPLLKELASPRGGVVVVRHRPIPSDEGSRVPWHLTRGGAILEATRDAVGAPREGEGIGGEVEQG